MGHFFLSMYSKTNSVLTFQYILHKGIVPEKSDCKSESVGCSDDKADSLEAELREIDQLESHLLHDEFLDDYKVE